jgi:ABC-type uncharacterized transport system permease subunit
MTGDQIIGFGAQTLSAAAPLLFAALGEVYSERVGVMNIGLEGLLLSGALAAVVVAALPWASPWLGVLAAVGAGVFGGLLFGIFGILLRRDQVIVGTTLNFLALGLTGVFYRAWTSGGTSAVIVERTLPRVKFGADAAVDMLSLSALLLVPLAWWLLFRTRIGVTLRAAGEVPEAAAASGARVNLWRMMVCLATGALCGLGGAALSIGNNNTFTEGMTAGRGFIALAVVVFGRWSPFGALGAALLFAAADVGQARLQAAGTFKFPYPLFLAIPYILTLVALAIRGARVRPPAALGQPFEQG